MDELLCAFENLHDRSNGYLAEHLWKELDGRFTAHDCKRVYEKLGTSRLSSTAKPFLDAASNIVALDVLDDRETNYVVLMWNFIAELE